ncbi:MAG: restriction endonuclease subunit S [Treponema sp.]|nr:restriction endonuclease subunit S [Treponema sp.]
MEGLEISIVPFSYVLEKSDICRFDSFFYSKNFLYEENLIEKHSNKSLKELNAKLLSFGAYSLNNLVEYKNTGIPFIRGVNMKNGILDFSDVIYIDDFAHKLLWKSEVNPEMILLSMSGTIGDVAIAMPQYKYPMNSNQDIAKIDLRNCNINPYFVYAYLCSQYGQNFLKREARGSVQQHVFLSQIENLKIPIFSDTFQSKIESMVKSAHAKLEESKSLYSQAEDLLLGELGLKDWQPKNTLHTTKKFSDFAQSGRLDAEYYQPKYDEIEKELSKKNTLEISKIGQICDKNFSPIDNVEYKYIELADIGAYGEITGCTMAIGSELPTRARRIVRKGDVLISSIEGSLQSCAIVPKEFDNALCSTGFYVMTPNKINAETLLILLKSTVIQLLLKKGCSGTILTNISKDEFLKIKLPILPEQIQKKIASLIQQSFEYKAQSKQLLEDAKRMVEEEIEKN